MFTLSTFENTYTILLQLINQSLSERLAKMFHSVMARYTMPTFPLIPIFLHETKVAGKVLIFFPPSHTSFNANKALDK